MTRSVMARLLDAAGWDAGSLRHKQLQDALDGARLAIVPANLHENLVNALTKIDTLATCSGVVDPAQHKNMLDNIYHIARGALRAATVIAEPGNAVASQGRGTGGST